MNTDYVRNPKTGRPVKIGSATYRQLINQKVLKHTRKDPKVAYKLDEDDDINAIKKDLKKKIKLKKGETLRTGTGKNKGKIMIAYKGGRYKKDESDSDHEDSDDFDSLCKKLNVSFPKEKKYSSSEHESSSDSEEESD